MPYRFMMAHKGTVHSAVCPPSCAGRQKGNIIECAIIKMTLGTDDDDTVEIDHLCYTGSLFILLRTSTSSLPVVTVLVDTTYNLPTFATCSGTLVAFENRLRQLTMQRCCNEIIRTGTVGQ